MPLLFWYEGTPAGVVKANLQGKTTACLHVCEVNSHSSFNELLNFTKHWNGWGFIHYTITAGLTFKAYGYDCTAQIIQESVMCLMGRGLYASVYGQRSSSKGPGVSEKLLSPWRWHWLPRQPRHCSSDYRPTIPSSERVSCRETPGTGRGEVKLHMCTLFLSPLTPPLSQAPYTHYPHTMCLATFRAHSVYWTALAQDVVWINMERGELCTFICAHQAQISPEDINKGSDWHMIYKSWGGVWILLPYFEWISIICQSYITIVNYGRSAKYAKNSSLLRHTVLLTPVC